MRQEREHNFWKYTMLIMGVLCLFLGMILASKQLLVLSGVSVFTGVLLLLAFLDILRQEPTHQYYETRYDRQVDIQKRRRRLKLLK